MPIARRYDLGTEPPNSRLEGKHRDAPDRRRSTLLQTPGANEPQPLWIGESRTVPMMVLDDASPQRHRPGDGAPPPEPAEPPCVAEGMKPAPATLIGRRMTVTQTRGSGGG